MTPHAGSTYFAAFCNCPFQEEKDLLAAVRQMGPDQKRVAWDVIEDLEDLRSDGQGCEPLRAQEMEADGRRTLELAEGALDFGRWLHRQDSQ